MTVRGADYRRRKNDDYPTPATTTECLFRLVRFGSVIIDPACGKDRKILNVAATQGYTVKGTDIILGRDFLAMQKLPIKADIVTNPPYGDRRASLARQFIEHALQLTNRKVAMLLPVDFDSGKTRQHLFSDCPQFTQKIVLLDRVKWFNNEAGSVNHAWFIWDKKHKGLPTIRYIRDGEQP